MCRWFAYISPTEPCLLEDVLVTPAHALSKQVHEHYLPKLLSHDPSIQSEPTTEAEITTRNRLFNVDGFGMAWYTPTLSTFSSQKPTLHPALYKSIQPPLHDSIFRSLCSNTCSKVLLAHIRAATATAITPTNNHPFTFGIYTIMHNGYISSFSEIKLALCAEISREAYAHIQGGTDTEHLAALIITYLCPSSSSPPDTTPKEWEIPHTPQEILTAIRKAIRTLHAVQKKVLGDKTEPNDLNICITSGTSLVATRYRNHPTEQPPSLYYSTTAGVTLNRQFPDHPDGKEGPHGAGNGKSSNGKKAAAGAEGHNPDASRGAEEHGRHVIVASEPTTYKQREWVLVGKNRAVIVEPEGEVSVEEIGV